MLQGKYVVLFFYPLDFTFVCPTEITAFSDRHGDFAKLNAEVEFNFALQSMSWVPPPWNWSLLCFATGAGNFSRLTVLSLGMVPDR